MIKLVFISDVHGKWNNITIPECDILISSGDYSFRGEKLMIKDFHKWLNKQPAKHIISVQGNHELWVEKNFAEAKDIAEAACPRVHFVDEGLVEIEGIKIWCSAITPFFGNWAWNRHRGPEIKRHWDFIPDDTDILVTHGPPYSFLDQLDENGSDPFMHVGCKNLFDRVLEVKPKIHAFGHIHCGYGIETNESTTFINAAICDEMYRPNNLPIEISIERK